MPMKQFDLMQRMLEAEAAAFRDDPSFEARLRSILFQRYLKRTRQTIRGRDGAWYVTVGEMAPGKRRFKYLGRGPFKTRERVEAICNDATERAVAQEIARLKKVAGQAEIAAQPPLMDLMRAAIQLKRDGMGIAPERVER
jgi:hypothetical protein